VDTQAVAAVRVRAGCCNEGIGLGGCILGLLAEGPQGSKGVEACRFSGAQAFLMQGLCTFQQQLPEPRPVVCACLLQTRWLSALADARFAMLLLGSVLQAEQAGFTAWRGLGSLVGG